MSLFPELKAFKASLIRNDFTKFSNSREFSLVLLENNVDEFYKKFVPPGSALNPQAKLNAYIDLLNHILLQWVKFEPGSSNSEALKNDFNIVLKATIESFIDWSEELNHSAKLIQTIEGLGPIKVETVKSIEKKINHKYSEKKINVTKEIVESNHNNYFKIDYAIITALEEDEMEKVLPMLVKKGEITDTKNFIEYGHLKNNPAKKVAYASQHKTGTVDASILATEIIVRFRPKFLIMTGVLGGKPGETNIGDVVIATKVIEIDRGKITDLGFKKETSASSTDSREIKKIHRNKKDIESYINSKDETRSQNIRVHFGPIACVNQVIDIEGFFDSNITSVERKAIALEMESYAIVRACELAGNNNTVPLILKSVMDNTQAKVDDAKPYAAWTSARALEYILEKELI